MGLITFKTFDNSIDAHILKIKLESEGITCFLFDEHMVSVNPLYSQLIGGIKLKINEEDLIHAKNIVLEAYLNGERIKAGSKIRMGSKIDLVVANGAGSEEFAVPDLYGKTFYEAKIYLESVGLIVLPIPDGDISDTNSAYVNRQSPAPFTPEGMRNRIRQGEVIDVFISSEKKPRQVPDSIPAPDPNN